MVAAAIRTIFAQPDAEHVREQLEVIATMLGQQFPKVETMLREHARTSPPSPTSRSRTGRRSGRPTRWSGSTRRSNDAPTSSGSSRTPQALLRLAGCVLIEVHDEWQIAERRYLSEGSMALIDAQQRPRRWSHPNSSRHS